MYIVAAILLVAVIIALALILPGVIHPKNSSGSNSNPNQTVLEPQAFAVASIGVQQWADVTFLISQTEVLSGAITTSNTITVYVMNDAQFATLIKNLTIVGYEWTSGSVWNATINYTASPGSWNLVFYDSNPYGSTGYLVTSAIVLTKG